MGWLKKKFKQVQAATGFDTLANAAITVGTIGLNKSDALLSKVTGQPGVGDVLTKQWQDLSGHTAAAQEADRMRLATANAKALAEANSAVNKDTADVILGATDSTAGDSLDTLRKRKQISGASMVGIV